MSYGSISHMIPKTCVVEPCTCSQQGAHDMFSCSAKQAYLGRAQRQ